MNGYFKPLRRKIGVVTLVLACVFAAGWVRSQSKYDFVEVPRGQTSYFLASRIGLLSFRRVVLYQIRDTAQITWRSGDMSKVVDWFDSNGKLHLWREYKMNWRRTWGDFDVGEGTGVSLDHNVGLTIPYWSIVIPLTLLSAWLLLSRPRAPKTIPPAIENA